MLFKYILWLCYQVIFAAASKQSNDTFTRNFIYILYIYEVYILFSFVFRCRWRTTFLVQHSLSLYLSLAIFLYIYWFSIVIIIDKGKKYIWNRWPEFKTSKKLNDTQFMLNFSNLIPTTHETYTAQIYFEFLFILFLFGFVGYQADGIPSYILSLFLWASNKLHSFLS